MDLKPNDSTKTETIPASPSLTTKPIIVRDATNDDVDEAVKAVDSY